MSIDAFRGEAATMKRLNSDCSTESFTGCVKVAAVGTTGSVESRGVASPCSAERDGTRRSSDDHRCNDAFNDSTYGVAQPFESEGCYRHCSVCCSNVLYALYTGVFNLLFITS